MSTDCAAVHRIVAWRRAALPPGSCGTRFRNAHPGLDEHRDRRQSLACGHGALWVLRHFFAIALLPFTVAVLIPIWLARRNAVILVAGSGLTQVFLQVAGQPESGRSRRPV